MKLLSIFKSNYLPFTNFVALTATLGSLFFSEVQGLTPCILCWYQRIFMYPIAVISVIAVLTKDHKAYKYNLVLAVTGFLIATYHYLIQIGAQAGAEVGGFCDPSNPCTTIDFQLFGFLTIPLLSALAFLIIIITNLIPLIKFRSEKAAN